MTRGVAVVLGLVAALSLGACTATSSPSGPSTTAGSTTTPTSSPPDVTGTPPIETSPSTPLPTTSASSTPRTSSAPTTSAPVSSSRPTTSASSPSTSAPAPARSSCTKLTIRVLLGSGAPGYEFAALQFVNDGPKACTLVGVPTVTLLRNGAPTGTVSQPSTAHAAVRTYRLERGAVAESKLKDFSSCNAPLSQSIRVVAPGSSISSTRPGELRACKLVVYPLGKPE